MDGAEEIASRFVVAGSDRAQAGSKWYPIRPLTPVAFTAAWAVSKQGMLQDLVSLRLTAEWAII
jgi:hypothetical protein